MPGLPVLPDLPPGLGGQFGMPPGPNFNSSPPQPEPEPAQRLWSPSAQDLADLNVPPGIAVRMIRENMILADEENMPIIPYEGGAPATAKDGNAIEDQGDLVRTHDGPADA